MRKSRPKRQPSGDTPSRPARPQRLLGPLDSETLYQDIFENANDAIALFSLDGVITAVNRGAERLLGWAREELIGQPVSKVATPAAVASALTGGATAGVVTSPGSGSPNRLLKLVP